MSGELEKLLLSWKRLKKARLTKRRQALVVQACAESTALFDAAVWPGNKSEIKKIQKSADKVYRYIWSCRNKQPLREMEETQTNMFEVRRQLTVNSLILKIENRHLIHIGHILRMENSRLTKQVTLGWPGTEIADQHIKARQTIIGYWRK